MEETLFKLARAITDTGIDTVSSEGGTITYRITSLKRKLVNGKVVSTSTPSCTLDSASVSWAIWKGVTVEDGYLNVKINYSKNIGSSRSTTLTFVQNESNNKINLTVTQREQKASTFTLSGLPTTKSYFFFGEGARPQNTSSDIGIYLQGISETGTTTITIPFYANDSKPGTLIECTTGDKVTVYTRLGATWVLEGSFIVPNAGVTVSVLYSVENKVLKLEGGRSTQDVSAEIKNGISERWTIQSQKTKYVNGKWSGVISVDYSASINNPDYVLEEDKSINGIQITARNDGTSGTCVLTQNESGNRINLKITTPKEEKEYWETPV